MDAISSSTHTALCPPKKSHTQVKECPTNRNTISRNPYLNFLRQFRKQNCGLSPVETIIKGAQAWKSLTREKKLCYIEEAFYAPKPKKRRKSYSRTTSAAAKSRGRVKKTKRGMDSMTDTSMSRARRRKSTAQPNRRGGEWL